MKKRRKVENRMIPLKENILEQKKNLHDVKVEFFMEILKMDEKVKALEKHLDIVSHINSKMESLQVKIDKLDKWRNTEKSVPRFLPAIKAYDIKFHTLDMNECQELSSKFKEKARKSLTGMMNVFDKSIYDVQRYLQLPEINFRDEPPVSFSFFKEIQEKYEMIKVEVQAKEVISKDNIQEFLVKPSMECSHYTSFVKTLYSRWRNSKNEILLLM